MGRSAKAAHTADSLSQLWFWHRSWAAVADGDGVVRSKGWSRTPAARQDEIGPGFACTIGLAHTHGGPELAMFGLDPRYAPQTQQARSEVRRGCRID
ncbi:DUF4262 domain-containing protein [Streptomyces sp. NPDC002403]